MHHTPERLEWKHQPWEEWRTHVHPSRNLDNDHPALQERELQKRKNDALEGEMVWLGGVHCCTAPCAGYRYPTNCRQRCGTGERNVGCHTAAVPRWKGAWWALKNGRQGTVQGNSLHQNCPRHDTRDSPYAVSNTSQRTWMREGKRVSTGHQRQPGKGPPVAEDWEEGGW